MEKEMVSTAYSDSLPTVLDERESVKISVPHPFLQTPALAALIGPVRGTPIGDRPPKEPGWESVAQQSVSRNPTNPLGPRPQQPKSGYVVVVDFDRGPIPCTTGQRSKIAPAPEGADETLARPTQNNAIWLLLQRSYAP